MTTGKRRILVRGVTGHRKELFPSSETQNSPCSHVPETPVDESHVPETPMPETPVDDSETQYFGSPLINDSTPASQSTSTPVVEPGESSFQGARQTLHPDGLWFHNNKVSNAITDILQAHFLKPWINYKKVDNGTKAHWWNQFKARFIWSPNLQNIVEKEYKKKAAKRLSDLSYNYNVRHPDRPIWMGETVFEQLLALRKDDKFLKKSEQAKKNRRGGSLSNPIEPSHFQGSISSVQHAKKMAMSSGGVLPSAPEVFLKTHFKDVPGKGKVPANKRAREIADAYEKKVEECTTQGSQLNPNQLYWEAVGGRKRGLVKGLGHSDRLFYEPPPSRGDGSSQPYCPSINSQVEARV